MEALVSCSCAYVGSLFSLCRWSRCHHSEGAGSFSGVGQAIGNERGSKAASLSIAEQYVQAFSQLAKTNNTLLLPEKTGDISSMVAQVHHTCTEKQGSLCTSISNIPPPPTQFLSWELAYSTKKKISPVGYIQCSCLVWKGLSIERERIMCVIYGLTSIWCVKSWLYICV